MIFYYQLGGFSPNHLYVEAGEHEYRLTQYLMSTYQVWIAVEIRICNPYPPWKIIHHLHAYMTHICRNPSAMIISCLMMFRHDVLVRYKVTYFKAILIDIYSLSHCQLHSDSYLSFTYRKLFALWKTLPFHLTSNLTCPSII